MSDAGSFDHARALELHLCALEVVEQPGAGSEEDGDDVECTSSIRPAFRYCWATLAPPAKATSFPAAASRACSSADSMPSVTKMKVVPPSFTTGSRAWCVTMKTGVWKGGSSPHQPSQGCSSPRARAAEHVPAHHGRADVLERLLDDLGRSVDLAALEPCGCAALQLYHPLVELLASLAERILLALVRPGDEAVKDIEIWNLSLAMVPHSIVVM